MVERSSFQNHCTIFNRFIVTYHSNNLHINRSIKVFPIFEELVLNHLNKDNDFISKQGKNYDMLKQLSTWKNPDGETVKGVAIRHGNFETASLIAMYSEEDAAMQMMFSLLETSS